MDSSQPAPSGSVLPAFLRRKWKAENVNSSEDVSSKSSPQHLSEDELYHQITQTEKLRIMHRVLTAREIEQRMEQISKDVIVDIQKQIHRGEEAYYEETNGHGNMFRGWDAFVDSKDIGAAHAAVVPQGSRRIPADCRWFASSCKSISRSSRPPSSLQKNPPSSRPSSALSSLPARLSSVVESSDHVPTETQSSIPETVSAIKDENESLSAANMAVDVKAKPVEHTIEIEKEARETKTADYENTSVIPSETGSGVKRKRQDDKPSDEGDDNRPKTTKKQASSLENYSAKSDSDDEKQETSGSHNKEAGQSEEEEMDVGEAAKKSESGSEEAERSKANEDPVTTRSGESKAASGKKEEKSKKEEPQKRRSSRNRK